MEAYNPNNSAQKWIFVFCFYTKKRTIAQIFSIINALWHKMFVENILSILHWNRLIDLLANILDNRLDKILAENCKMFAERLFFAIIVAFVLPIVLTIAEDAKQTGTAAATPVSGKKGAFDEEAEHEDEPNIPGSSGGGTSLVSTKTKTKRKGF